MNRAATRTAMPAHRTGEPVAPLPRDRAAAAAGRAVPPRPPAGAGTR